MKYNILDQILHDQFLGDTNISEFLYKRLIRKSNTESIKLKPNEHIFITGLARSGTTALLNNLYEKDEFASLLYRNMPFILSPKLANLNFGNHFNKNILRTKRLHNDGLFISLDSPECLDEPFWIKANLSISANKFKVSKRISKDILEGYSYFINEYCQYQNKERAVLKNNNNHMRLKILSNHFKKSHFLVLFRNPLFHANSLLKQHFNFIKIQSQSPFILRYMDMLGHREFGMHIIPFCYPTDTDDWYNKYDVLTIEYWLRQWISTYSWFIKEEIHKKRNVFLISYEKLCNDNKYYKNLIKSLNLKKSYSNRNLKSSNNKYINHKSKLLNEALDIYEQLTEFSFS